MTCTILLTATVKNATGKTRHSIGSISSDGTLQTDVILPTASYVEIAEEEDGYFLFGYASDGEFAGDSWFASIEEAKKQAKFEYEIDEDDWQNVE